MIDKIKVQVRKMEAQRAKLYALWLRAVQDIANRHQVDIATGQMSDLWQISKPGRRQFKGEGDIEHPALTELAELDEIAREFGVGPTNMESFKPKIKRTKCARKTDARR